MDLETGGLFYILGIVGCTLGNNGATGQIANIPHHNEAEQIQDTQRGRRHGTDTGHSTKQRSGTNTGHSKDTETEQIQDIATNCGEGSKPISGPHRSYLDASQPNILITST